MTVVMGPVNLLGWSERWADVSECTRYRYALGRRWADAGRVLTFVMLNPSTADALKDDATVRKCVGFATRLGYSALVIVNLYAWRATDALDLPKARDGRGVDVRGPRNDAAVLQAVRAADGVLAAWGDSVRRMGIEGVKDAARMRDMLNEVTGGKVYQLGDLTDDDNPRHPLMLGYDTPLVPLQGVRPPVQLVRYRDK